MVVLDSDILVGFLRNDKEAINFMDELEKRNEKLNTTVISAFELFKGALISPSIEKIKQAENFLRAFGSYNFDNLASRKAAEISVHLDKKGEKIDFEDIAIASIAIVYGEILITRNVKHFNRIKDLKIEKW